MVCYWPMYVDGLLQVFVRVFVGGLLLVYVWSAVGVDTSGGPSSSHWSTGLSDCPVSHCTQHC